MTFTEFTNKITTIFQDWDIEIDEKGIKLTYAGIVGKSLVFSKDEFNLLYEKNKINSSDNLLEIYRDDYYEILLQSDSLRYNLEYDNKDYHDNVNKIQYRRGNASRDLVFWLLYNGDAEMLYALIRQQRIVLRLRINEMFQDPNIPLLDFISQLTLRRYSSLIIETYEKTTLSKMQSYMYAFVYTYMFNKQDSLYPVFDIISLFPQRIFRRKADDFDCPKKTYIQELISYYNEAISSSILSHKYLSFYHILEYFYENIFMEDQISKVREIITDPGFSYKRSKDVAKLINKVQAKAFDKDVSINEKVALTLLIQKHIPQDQLQDRLIDRYGQEFLDILKKKVGFSDGDIIIFSKEDEQQYIRSITNRIYKTRNAIVHSKESFTDDKKNNKYRSIRDDKELFYEIALIQVIAEMIINENAKEI